MSTTCAVVGPADPCRLAAASDPGFRSGPAAPSHSATMPGMKQSGDTVGAGERPIILLRDSLRQFACQPDLLLSGLTQNPYCLAIKTDEGVTTHGSARER